MNLLLEKILRTFISLKFHIFFLNISKLSPALSRQKYYVEVGICLTRNEKGIEYKINCLNGKKNYCCRKTSGLKSIKYCCDFDHYLDNILLNFFSISIYFFIALIASIALLVINFYLFLKQRKRTSLETVESKMSSDLEISKAPS